MKYFQQLNWLILAIALLGVSARRVAADDAAELVDTIIGFLTDDDKETRAIGLEQVREKAPGQPATLRFAGLLPKLKPDGQVALVAALADRGDAAAHDAVLEVARSDNEACRAAALRALGTLGGAGDVPLLVSGLASSSDVVHGSATAGLTRLVGPPVNAAIVAAAKKAHVAQRAELIRILVARHAVDTVPDFLASSRDPQASVRAAAFDAIGQLAGKEQIPTLFGLALAAPTATDRELIERALVLVSDRTGDADHRADAALAVYATLDDAKKLALLPTLGRLGGSKIHAMVETALLSSDAKQHAAGVMALCNWPNGSVAAQLLDLCKTSADAAERQWAIKALIRVAPLPDQRPADEKLKMVQAAMALATSDIDRSTILKRASAIRTMDTVHWVLGYFDDPKLSEAACASMVEMAHHRELRHPNKPEFEKILDRVMATSKDAVVIERANRYKNEQTYKREKKATD